MKWKFVHYPFLIAAIILLLQSKINAGNPEFNLQDTASQTVITQSASSKHSLFAGTGYGSNLLFAGSSISANKGFLSADILYSFMGSLWASGVAYNIPGIDVNIPMYDLSAGYNHTFNDWFDASLSLSGYLTHQGVRDDLYNSFAYLRMAIGFDWMLLYTRASMGKILEENSGVYINIRNSRYMRTPKFGASGNYISFDPSLNFLIGNYSQLQTITTPQRPGGIIRPGRPGSGQEENTEYEIVDTYKVMQAELSLPISFYFYDFIFDAEPLYLIPVLKDENYISPKGFHFFFNITYRLF
jgi:hypothetical protein